MDRRNALKAMSISPLTAGLFLTGFDETDKKELEELANEVAPVNQPENAFDFENGRTPEELARDAELMKKTFFNEHEMKTIGKLVDIIIPADEKSGSASEAKVPDFIEFIVKDMPNHQTPMRGGLRWLDVQSLKQTGKNFIESTDAEQIKLIDQIAYPQKAKPEMKQGVAFFNLMRNLTASGYFTSEIGIKYIEYKGNTPNNWEGVPADVLAKYGLSY